MKYQVVGEMTITVLLTVEAESEDAAREVAEAASTMTLCHQCAHGADDEWSTSGELDGEPEILEIRPIGRRP